MVNLHCLKLLQMPQTEKQKQEQAVRVLAAAAAAACHAMQLKPTQLMEAYLNTQQ
jgi:hypothetical protein